MIIPRILGATIAAAAAGAAAAALVLTHHPARHPAATGHKAAAAAAVSPANGWLEIGDTSQQTALLFKCTVAPDGYTLRVINRNSIAVHLGQVDVVMTRGGQQTGQADPWIGQDLLPGYTVPVVTPQQDSPAQWPDGTACRVASWGS